MKRIKIYNLGFAFILMFFAASISQQTFGQAVQFNEKKIIDTEAFTGVEANGALKVQLIQADVFQVSSEAEAVDKGTLNVEVRDNILHLNAISRQHNVPTVLVMAPDFTKLAANGVSQLESIEMLHLNKLQIQTEGAAKIILELTANELETRVNGAGEAILRGEVDFHKAEVSGASKLSSKDLETKSTNIVCSGASVSYINVKEQLRGEISGVAKLNYDEEPAVLKEMKDSRPKSQGKGSSDSVTINLGNMKVKVIEGDSTVIEIGAKKVVVDDAGNVNVSKKSKKSSRFEGHWQGLDLGINGLLTPDFSFDYPPAESYLDLRYEKSIAVNLNIFQQDIRFNKKGNFGLVSGLGLSWNNYRFNEDVLLQNENQKLSGYFIEGASVRKSKLTNTYLTIPLLIEIQSNSNKKSDKLFLSAGVVAGWRFLSHTKLYFNDSNRAYDLIDPASGLIVGSGNTPSARRRNIVKDFGGFQQNPFKVDLSVRAGWSFVQVFATYSVTPLFIKNRGPELYPFSIGISISTNQ